MELNPFSQQVGCCFIVSDSRKCTLRAVWEVECTRRGVEAVVNNRDIPSDTGLLCAVHTVASVRNYRLILQSGQSNTLACDVSASLRPDGPPVFRLE